MLKEIYRQEEKEVEEFFNKLQEAEKEVKEEDIYIDLLIDELKELTKNNTLNDNCKANQKFRILSNEGENPLTYIKTISSFLITGNHKFEDNEVTISSQINTKITKYSFCRCNGLKKVKIMGGYSKKRIDENAFYDCQNLEEIEVDEYTFDSINEHVFTKCPKLKIINVIEHEDDFGRCLYHSKTPIEYREKKKERILNWAKFTPDNYIEEEKLFVFDSINNDKYIEIIERDLLPLYKDINNIKFKSKELFEGFAAPNKRSVVEFLSSKDMEKYEEKCDIKKLIDEYNKEYKNFIEKYPNIPDNLRKMIEDIEDYKKTNKYSRNHGNENRGDFLSGFDIDENTIIDARGLLDKGSLIIQSEYGMNLWGLYQPIENKIYICIENIEKSIVDSKIDIFNDDTYELVDLIKSVIIHEYTHYIHRNSIKNEPQLENEKIKGVDETIAETIQILYSEKHLLNKISNYLKGHSSSGRFHSWPYGGADILLSMFGGKLHSTRKYLLEIINASIDDYEKAYKLIIDLQYLLEF